MSPLRAPKGSRQSRRAGHELRPLDRPLAAYADACAAAAAASRLEAEARRKPVRRKPREAAETAIRESLPGACGDAGAASLDAFAACLAHEVNQPVAAIMANSEAALRWLDRPLPDIEEARAALARITRDAARAAAVVSRMRGMAVNAAGQRQAVEVRQLIAESLQFTEFQLRRAQVRTEVEVAEGLPQAYVDAVQVQQVLVNLVTNAIDAMKTVSGRRRILSVVAEAGADGMIRIALADTGAGVGEGVAGRVFDHLFTTKPDGVGLGLPICRSIVEAHGGRIQMRANMPFGAEFSFTLPSAPPG